MVFVVELLSKMIYSSWIIILKIVTIAYSYGTYLHGL